MLTATVLGSGLAQLDGTVVNVALPRIGEDLGGGLTSLQWTLNAYTLTLSGLLLLGGSLGDRMGRRRIFVIGVLWFTAASVGCALAPGTDRADRDARPAGRRRGAADARVAGHPAGVVPQGGQIDRGRRLVRAGRGGNGFRADPGRPAGRASRRGAGGWSS